MAPPPGPERRAAGPRGLAVLDPPGCGCLPAHLPAAEERPPPAGGRVLRLPAGRTRPDPPARGPPLRDPARPPAQPADAVLAFAVLEFWDARAAGQQTLTLERLLFHPGSPGAAFRLDDRSLVAALERLPKDTGLRYDETAGLRGLHRRGAPRPLSLLERWYRN